MGVGAVFVKKKQEKLTQLNFTREDYKTWHANISIHQKLLALPIPISKSILI